MPPRLGGSRCSRSGSRLAACGGGENDDVAARRRQVNGGNAPVVLREFAGENGAVVARAASRRDRTARSELLLTVDHEVRDDWLPGDDRPGHDTLLERGRHDRQAASTRDARGASRRASPCRLRRTGRSRSTSVVARDRPGTCPLGRHGLHHHRAAAAAAHRLGRREHAAAGQELDPGRRADLAARSRTRGRAPRSCVALGRREERRLGARRRRRCAGSRAGRRSPAAASCPGRAGRAGSAARS